MMSKFTEIMAAQDVVELGPFDKYMRCSVEAVSFLIEEGVLVENKETVSCDKTRLDQFCVSHPEDNPDELREFCKGVELLNEVSDHELFGKKKGNR